VVFYKNRDKILLYYCELTIIIVQRDTPIRVIELRELVC